MSISSLSARGIRLAQQRPVEINRRTNSTVEPRTSTAYHTKSTGGLSRTLWWFSINEVCEVVPRESKDLLAYFSPARFPAKL